MLSGIMINIMIFRNDFNNNADICIEKSITIFIISFMLVLVTGLLFQYQLPIASGTVC